MKKFFYLAILVFSLAACNQNAPTTYDKVAGHTYVSTKRVSIIFPDTLSFLSDGTIKNTDYSYTQNNQILTVRNQYVLYHLEVIDDMVMLWEKGYGFKRID